MYLDFVQQHIHVPYYANMECSSLGLDSKEHCVDSRAFDDYSPVLYQFNEIGFRTHSVKNFGVNDILVIGDSFTLGLGVNSNQRYTDIMEETLSCQVLNFALNGASNDWISRKLEQLLGLFDPRAIVIHYTFSHRRERPNLDWHDDERTECEPFYSSQENFNNWNKNFKRICTLANNIPLVHSFIPSWHDAPIDYCLLGKNILAPVPIIDYARDNFHYGIQTHQQLADAITNLLEHELHQSRES